MEGATAVPLCLGLLVGLAAGWLGAQVFGRARIEDLEGRLQLVNRLLREGRLKYVDQPTRQRLMLITSNVRNSVQRGK